MVFKSCMEKYSLWLGQTINEAKSLVFFSWNMRQSDISTIYVGLNMKKANSDSRYLGPPIILPRSKNCAFQELKEKILKKIAGWKANVFSQAGRATLIRAVASSPPAYNMSTFMLPKKLCQELDAKVHDFLWGFS